MKKDEDNMRLENEKEMLRLWLSFPFTKWYVPE